MSEPAQSRATEHLELDVSDGCTDLLQFVGSKVDASRSKVLIKMMSISRAWDRNDPRFLRQ